MTYNPNIPVGLCEILENKEARVKRQRVWLDKYSLPLISFTINMPGRKKISSMSNTIFEQGISAITEICSSNSWPVLTRQIIHENTGQEAIFIVEPETVTQLKQAMMRIEHTHKLGRLMDLDVINIDGQIVSRNGLGIKKRQCLVCDEEAVICIRSRAHTVDDLLTKVEEMITHA
jgi:holo-ACP synthase